MVVKLHSASLTAVPARVMISNRGSNVETLQKYDMSLAYLSGKGFH